MGKLAFVFAGQGAQSPGMGKELYERFDSAKRIFDMAGDEVKRLSFDGPAEELNLTINAQPCLFAVDLACAAALHENGVFADGAAGFSLGEIAACTYSGILNDTQALEFVQFRAQAMHSCALRNEGGMFAVLKLSAEDVEAICANLDKAYPVNYNCPGQTVVACAAETIESLMTMVTARGGKIIRLAVSGAFHSPYMDKASDLIAIFLESTDFGHMHPPVYANATARLYNDPAELLSRQVNSPVLWQKTIENMIVDGFDTFIELGPGKTLSGLIRKIDGSVRSLQVNNLASLLQTVTEVQNA